MQKVSWTVVCKNAARNQEIREPIMAVDARDAFSRVMTLARPNGGLIGEVYGVDVNLISEVDAGTQEDFKAVLGGWDLEIKCEGDRSYYVWVDGDCPDKTDDPQEAIQWCRDFLLQGRDSYVADDRQVVLDVAQPRQTQVRARLNVCSGSQWEREIQVNCLEWFKAQSIADIDQLVRDGLHNSECSDHVGLWLSEHGTDASQTSSIQALLTHMRDVHASDDSRAQSTVGITLDINKDDVRCFVVNHPAVAELGEAAQDVLEIALDPRDERQTVTAG